MDREADERLRLGLWDSTARSPWLQRAAYWSAGDPARGFEMPQGLPR